MLLHQCFVRVCETWTWATLSIPNRFTLAEACNLCCSVKSFLINPKPRPRDQPFVLLDLSDVTYQTLWWSRATVTRAHWRTNMLRRWSWWYHLTFADMSNLLVLDHFPWPPLAQITIVVTSNKSVHYNNFNFLLLSKHIVVYTYSIHIQTTNLYTLLAYLV